MKALDSSSTGKYSAILISPIIYFLISIGVSLQISGSNWDIVWHGVRNVETFFTPPHSVIYLGVALAIGSVITGIIQAGFRIRQQKNYATRFVVLTPSLLPSSLRLAAVGCALQLTAGPFDFLWHSLFGFDGLLSPPHSVLAVGMLMTALGALIGIYAHYSNPRSVVNDARSLSSIFSRLSLIIGFAVFLMVAIGMVLMFTLPFSKGQYFDFNPDPLAALVATSVSIPFILGTCLFIAVRITSSPTSNRIPFIFTFIVAVTMTIQSTTTITSNSYFAFLFPVYLLNIIPALIADILVFRYSQKKKSDSLLSSKMDDNKAKKWCLFATVLVSIFYITLYFPWTVDVFGGYFEPPSSLRTEQFLVHLLIPTILPSVIPVSIFSSLLGSLVAMQLLNSRKLIVWLYPGSAFAQDI
ncbi:MAG TPA: hypothetical protein VJ250_03180 [Nitrososphaeraceae archaeon]|nr:hypothetical protein [Nitrososphaeraceae archaeon]